MLPNKEGKGNRCHYTWGITFSLWMTYSLKKTQIDDRMLWKCHSDGRVLQERERKKEGREEGKEEWRREGIAVCKFVFFLFCSPQLLYRVADAIGKEVRAKHNDFVKRGIYASHTGASCFSPVINIVRDGRWGRIEVRLENQRGTVEEG